MGMPRLANAWPIFSGSPRGKETDNLPAFFLIDSSSTLSSYSEYVRVALLAEFKADSRLSPIRETRVFPYNVTSGTPAWITSLLVEPQL